MAKNLFIFVQSLQDCYTNFMDWIKRNHVILATCSVIVAVLQVLKQNISKILKYKIKKATKFRKQAKLFVMQEEC